MKFDNWFAELDQQLYQQRCWWQLKPFHLNDYPEHWAPELIAALNNLSDDDVSLLDTDAASAARYFKPFLPNIEQLLTLVDLPKTQAPTLAAPKHLNQGVPGRKWSQILAFTAAMKNAGQPVLEWCAGKGHLGRLVHACYGQSVISLEWDEALCCDGNSLAAAKGIDQRFICADAFSDQARDLVEADQHLIALHACGDLHVQLMKLWAEHQSAQLTFSPCCYHLIKSDTYQPLSAHGQASLITLDKQDLQLPLQETVTAGAGVKRQRQTELLWRMSFDHWQRQWRGIDEYLPLPTFKKRLLKTSFVEFCRWALEVKGLLKQGESALDVLQGSNEQALWLHRGEQRLTKLRRIELITHLYRRPLEIWLALDRALFLQEHGATVELIEFCQKAMTPRNIMIRAYR